jgi:hypothetical protein
VGGVYSFENMDNYGENAGFTHILSFFFIIYEASSDFSSSTSFYATELFYMASQNKIVSKVVLPTE